jgi:hypothetical protein
LIFYRVKIGPVRIGTTGQKNDGDEEQRVFHIYYTLETPEKCLRMGA